MSFSYWTQRGSKHLESVACQGCSWLGSTLDQGRRHVAATGHEVHAQETQAIYIKPSEGGRVL